MNHEPHDQGRISGAFQTVLGIDDVYAAVGQKTIKTMCGKRVSIAHAVHGADVTCPDCVTVLLREEEELGNLLILLEQAKLSS